VENSKVKVERICFGGLFLKNEVLKKQKEKSAKKALRNCLPKIAVATQLSLIRLRRWLSI